MAHMVNLPCVADTYINEASKSVNYGDSDRIISGRQGQNRQYALLRFDMSQLPPRKRYTAMRLKLYAIEDVNGSDAILRVVKDTEKNDYFYRTWVETEARWDRIGLPEDTEMDTYEVVIGGLWVGKNQYFDEFELPIEMIQSPKFVTSGVWFRWLAQNVANDNGIIVFGSRESSNPPILVVEYEDVPPDPPTPIDPIGSYNDLADTIRFSWQYNSPVGGEQHAFELQWSTDQVNWHSVEQTTNNTYYDMPAGTFPPGIVYWRIAYMNEYEEWSDWSDIQVFFAVGAPDLPIIQSITTNTARPVISWSALGQQFFRIQILAGDVIVFDSGDVPSISARSYKVTAFLEDGQYTARVRIRNEFGLYSDWSERTFMIVTAKPPKPLLAAQSSVHGIELFVSNPSVKTLIYRSENNEDFICIGEAKEGVFKDYTVKSGVEYRYFVRSVTAVEAYTDSDKKIVQPHLKHAQIALVSDLTNIFVFTRSLDGPPKRSYSNSPGGSFVQYSGRKRPVWEPDEHIAAGWSMTYFLRTWAEVEKFINLYDRKETVLYRDVKGRKMYGVMTGLTIDDDRYGYVVSFTVNEVDFKEEMEV